MNHNKEHQAFNPLTTLIASTIFLASAVAMANAAEHTVEISGLEFVPNTLTVSVGDTIKWVNRDIAPHTATADDDSWDTERISRGDTKTITVSKGMKTNYYCRFHPTMKASLTIKEK